MFLGNRTLDPNDRQSDDEFTTQSTWVLASLTIDNHPGPCFTFVSSFTTAALRSVDKRLDWVATLTTSNVSDSGWTVRGTSRLGVTDGVGVVVGLKECEGVVDTLCVLVGD
jgi:hypothetical protein